MELGLSPLAESGVLFGGVLAAALGVLAAFYFVWRRRNTPEERERRRRLKVHREGRITGGVLLDIEDADQARLVHYTYRIGAVDYAACQDVTSLSEAVGDDPKGVVGAVTVKVHQKNPYNSIVICEGWSGLRRQ